MSYRIHYTPAAKLKGGGGGDTTPPVESYDVGPKVKAAIICGLFAAALVGVLWSAFTLSPDSMRLWAKGMVGVAILGFLIACSLGFWWVYLAAYRPWRVDDITRKRQWKFEDAQLKAQQIAVNAAKEQTTRGDDADGNPLTLTDQQRLDMVAINMLERVYVHGTPERATRDAMCKDGVYMQFEWNLANKGLKAIGVRQKKSWEAMSFQQVFSLWRENVKLETDGDGDRYLMVLKQNGNWHAIERVE